MTPPDLGLILTVTDGHSYYYVGTFVTPDSVSGNFVGGFSIGGPPVPMSLKRQ
jgi:hypothetical protein